MASTFASLRADFFARGYDYMNDGGAGLTRTKELFNQSYLELAGEDDWPFLLTTASGAAPLAVADIRKVLNVVDTGTHQTLWGRTEDELIYDNGELTLTGVPLWYYLDDTTIRTYPSGGTIRVRYYKVPAELVNDADEPVIPNRFRRLIVEGMVRVAGAEDSPEAARAAEAERQQGLVSMRRDLLFRDGGPKFFHTTSTALDA